MEYREAMEWVEENVITIEFMGGTVELLLGSFERVQGSTFLTAVQKAMKLEESA